MACNGTTGRIGFGLCRVTALAAGLSACARDVGEREAAAARAVGAQLDELTVSVSGGVVVSATEGATPADPVRLILRATSFDVRVVLQDAGCAPRLVDVVVENVPSEATFEWRTWRGALSPAEEAERQCCGGLLGRTSALDFPDWTPVSATRTFTPGHVARVDGAEVCRTSGATGLAGAVAGDAVTRRCWRFGLEGATDRAAVLPPDAPTPAAPAQACADFDTVGGGPVRQAPFIAVQHVRWRPPATETPDGERVVRLAVFGNHAGVGSVRRAIVQAVADRIDTDDVRFALVTGDLASDGSRASLDAAVADLDALPVPWFATVGERDVDGAAPEDLVARFGALTDAFDVISEGGAVSFRVVLLDSADAGLSRRSFRLLDAWLGDPDAPSTRLVATHVPPFEPHGLRGKGFKRRSEAGRLVAALGRGAVADLFTSHLAIWERQQVGPVVTWHSGGGGAPMETIDGDKHHFLIVSVNDSGTISVERVDL
ncbi:hypothetical protein L6V77_01045 [Myxococcota bacterium]|nr:hypothetical protein [Myxococcota bacterium]